MAAAAVRSGTVIMLLFVHFSLLLQMCVRGLFCFILVFIIYVGFLCPFLFCSHYAGEHPRKPRRNPFRYTACKWLRLGLRGWLGKSFLFYTKQ